MIRQLAEEFCPHAKKIVLVSDNLNTHALSSLYEAFPAHIALAVAHRIEMHHTPLQGSWLNMAETELSALSMQYAGKKRTNNLEDLNSMLQVREQDRNVKRIGINWQFTAEDARIKLKRLYPEPVLVVEGIMSAHGPPKNSNTVLEFIRQYGVERAGS